MDLRGYETENRQNEYQGQRIYLHFCENLRNLRKATLCVICGSQQTRITPGYTELTQIRL